MFHQAEAAAREKLEEPAPPTPTDAAAEPSVETEGGESQNKEVVEAKALAPGAERLEGASEEAERAMVWALAEGEVPLPSELRLEGLDDARRGRVLWALAERAVQEARLMRELRAADTRQLKDTGLQLALAEEENRLLREVDVRSLGSIMGGR